MALFQYRAVQGDGAIAQGNIDAGSRQEAFRQLESKGLKPINVTEGGKAAQPKNGGGFLPQPRKVSQRDLENFTRQLSSLLASGVPLSRAMSILCREAASPAAKEQWKKINDLVVNGTSLASAMASSPQTFPKVYTAMVEAGETGGFLDLVLKQIADFQSREKELRAKVVSAMVYPCVLAFIAVVVVIFLMLFFIPKFQEMFADMGVALPLITTIVVSISEFVGSKYGALGGFGIVFGAYLFQQWLQSEQGRRKWQHIVLRLPVIGPLVARYAMARFCRMLGTLLSSGVPLMTSLRVSSDTIGNQTLTDAIANSIERVKQGDALAASLSDCKELFSGSVIEMVAVAEESGRLDKELMRLAVETEEEMDRSLRMAVSLMEPAMLVVMASIIAVIFIAMVLPIFEIGDHIN